MQNQEKDYLVDIALSPLPQADLEDIELVTGYKRIATEKGVGSEEANQIFNSIFHKYTNLILFLARKKGIVEGEVEDIKQLVFLSVWQRLNSDEQITNLKGIILHSFKCRAATYFEKTYHKKANDGQAIQFFSITKSIVGLPVRGERRQSIKSAGGKEFYLDVARVEPGFSPALLEKLYDTSDTIEERILHKEQIVQMRQQLCWIFDNIPTNYGTALRQQLAGLELADIAAKNSWTLDQTKKYVVRGRQWIVKHRHLLEEDAA